MRGRKADIRSGFARPVERPGTAQAADLSVLTTVTDRFLKVSAAELDAIEAFLMPQILALLNDNRPSDSEVPQYRAKNISGHVSEGVRREILVEDTV